MMLAALTTYACPKCRGSLALADPPAGDDDSAGGTLTCKKCGRGIPIREGMPCFLDQAAVTGSDLKFQKFYDRLSPVYDPIIRFASRFLFGGDIAFRGEFASHLEIQPGDRVLEVSVGSGGNFPYIGTFTGHLRLFGLDISGGFLKRCRKNLKKWNIHAELCQGNADELPYADNSFDCVYHKGGINGFSNKSRALAEMYRVARPGSLITVSDETEDMFYTRKQFKKLGLPNFKELGAPVELVPAGAEDIELVQTGGGMMYLLKFRKPGSRTKKSLKRR